MFSRRTPQTQRGNRWTCDCPRLHRTQEEAQACLHDLGIDHFSLLDLLPDRIRKPRNRTTPVEAPNAEALDGDDDEDLPVLQYGTLTPKSRARSISSTPSAPGKRGQDYPTPAYTQGSEDIGDNINVAMASSSQLPSSSPAATAAVRRASPAAAPVCGVQVPSSISDAPLEEYDDDGPGPLSSSPPPRSSASKSPATTRVPETVFDDTTLVNHDTPNEKDTNAQRIADLENEILSLRADRARLTELLKDSTFTKKCLQTRGKIDQINAKLARLDAEKARAQALAAQTSGEEAVDTMEAVEAATRSARRSFTVLLGMAVLYMLYCWYYTVEFAYIRKRKCWVYGLGEGC